MFRINLFFQVKHNQSKRHICVFNVWDADEDEDLDSQAEAQPSEGRKRLVYIIYLIPFPHVLIPAPYAPSMESVTHNICLVFQTPI